MILRTWTWPPEEDTDTLIGMMILQQLKSIQESNNYFTFFILYLVLTEVHDYND